MSITSYKLAELAKRAERLQLRILTIKAMLSDKHPDKNIVVSYGGAYKDTGEAKLGNLLLSQLFTDDVIRVKLEALKIKLEAELHNLLESITHGEHEFAGLGSSSMKDAGPEVVYVSRYAGPGD